MKEVPDDNGAIVSAMPNVGVLKPGAGVQGQDVPSLAHEISMKRTPPANSGKLIKMLCVGEKPERSAPTRTLAAALHPHRVRALFSDEAEQHSTRRFLRLALQSDLILCVAYDGPNEFVLRRLALAKTLGRPLIRWWVGTDVFRCLRDEAIRRRARMLDRFVSLNIAVAPHLVQELTSIGIQARFLPSVVYPRPDRIVTSGGHVLKSLLVYLPFERRDFYGEPLVRRAIEANPDVNFSVVADDTHALTCYPNVRSLGWVEDMGSIFATVGGLLRITEHDGMPRMVLESLLRGKYVIYSWPFPGCWLARTFEDLQQKMDQFRRVTQVNHEGIKTAQQLLAPDPGIIFADSIRSVLAQPESSRRLRAATTAAYLTSHVNQRVLRAALPMKHDVD